MCRFTRSDEPAPGAEEPCVENNPGSEDNPDGADEAESEDEEGGGQGAISAIWPTTPPRELAPTDEPSASSVGNLALEDDENVVLAELSRKLSSMAREVRECVDRVATVMRPEGRVTAGAFATLEGMARLLDALQNCAAALPALVNEPHTPALGPLRSGAPALEGA